jgi:hypothetical protein
MTSEIEGNIQWSAELETYFKATAEKAHGLAYLHKKAETLFSGKRNWIDIPVIVGSGIIAFLNAGSASMFAGNTLASSVALGIGSLCVGVINTIGTYFGYAKRAEGHRISAIQYNRLYRFLSVELSLPRGERMIPHDLLKHTKDSIDRLDEVSPLLPPSVIQDFQTKFDKITDIAKPEEANGLERVIIYHDDKPVMLDNPLRKISAQSTNVPVVDA